MSENNHGLFPLYFYIFLCGILFKLFLCSKNDDPEENESDLQGR